MKLVEKLERAEDRISDLEDALRRIRQWCDTYPTEFFSPMSDDEVKRAVAAAGAEVSNASDRLHASWARHILSGVRGYTDILGSCERSRND